MGEYFFEMTDTKIIWKAYSEDLRRFVLSKTKDETITDDLLQEIFIKIHTNIEKVRDLRKLKSWLFTVAHNTVMDYFRTAKNGLANIEDPEQTETLVADGKPADFYEHTEHDCLYGIIKNLDKKYRVPLFMADIKGCKQQEIADRLGLPLPTVKSQIQRARKMIAQGFMDCCGYELNENGKLVGELKSKEECKVCG